MFKTFGILVIVICLEFGAWNLEFCFKSIMPPTADQIEQIKNIYLLYKTHVRSAVVKHKKTVRKNLAELDRRKTNKIRQALLNKS